jgi:hypothetical protein
MTKYYGSLLGTPKQANRPINVSSSLERGSDHILARDTILLAAAAIADTFQLAVLPWETVIDPFRSDWSWAAQGAGAVFNVGDVTFPTALNNALAVNALGTGKLLASVAIANYFKPLWQLLGYANLAAAKAVGLQCELLCKVTGAAATGQVTWQLSGRQQ